MSDFADQAQDAAPVLPPWPNYAEARTQIAVLELTELHQLLGLPLPRLLPLAWPGLLLGLLLLAWGAVGRQPPLVALGLIPGVYGLIVMSLNRTRIHDYRHNCYRSYIRRHAEQLQNAQDDLD
jgi:hypothetical protein